MLIDIHCHLDLCKDIDKVIENARKNNVEIIITHGVNKETNRKSLELSKKYKEVKVALGIYPIDALNLNDKEIEDEIEFIRKNKKDILAIGEVGMDFKEDEKEHERQEKIFKDFIKLSIELNKPVIVHSRKAEEECIDILEKMNAKKVIMHCFCGKKRLIQQIIKNNWYLTIPTNVIHSQQFQWTAENISIDRLFCETDSPYLHPEKNGQNKPSNVIESYKKISELKKIDLKKVSSLITKNFNNLFINQ